MKQETLEDAAKKKYGTSIYDFEQVDAFISGANWQAERSFTLEQIDELFFGDNGRYFDDFLDYRLGLTGSQGKNKITFKEWFEKFKKK